MSVQDIAVTVIAVAFIFTLVPALRGAQKPPVVTSLTLALGLAGYAVVYATLGLWLGAATVAAQAVLWAVLCTQRARQTEVR